MDIYAIFNTETGVYQAALIQGEEENGGQFDSFGDERFEQASQIKNLFSNSTDWILISEEDFAKYMLGTSGGDNDTGYLYDFSTGRPISAPAREYTLEEKQAELETNYNKAAAVIKDTYLDAVLTNDDTTVETCKTQYQRLSTDYNNLNQQLIDDFFNDKEDEDNGDS